ncbi:hypothetical protein LSS_22875 [Leptospira santarosai serovar Shermani str. LT 821]|uniref:Uncharacterized protein n=1 Tax=Leptospira santarosai serovar Shermani str. LT 821 TaxID=758847 RepID=A0A097ESY4_9LEPT|nr:hypothetical protein LSS_22875 [Leptospira santarosai serovar Shermani str. LT 821]
MIRTYFLLSSKNYPPNFHRQQLRRSEINLSFSLDF